MNIVIEIYIIICICLLLFDILFLVVKNYKKYELYPRNNSLGEKIQAEIAYRKENGVFSDGFEEELDRKLGKTKNLLTLQTELERNPEAADWFLDSVYRQVEIYRKKTDYEQAYYTYVISAFDYEGRELPASFVTSFMPFLDSRSLYTFTNTMDALYRFGNVNLLLSAVDKADERAGFYHKKLLVDGLLSAKADKGELKEKLLERFDQYCPYTQNCLLDLFRMNGSDVAELCLELMEDKQADAEVRYGAMRYFIKYPHEQAKQYFEKVLEENTGFWVEQMLAIQALGCYDDAHIYDIIKGKITDFNWHIRVNAGAYLKKYGVSREDMFEILQKRDKYAEDTLLYQYRDDPDMYQYIKDTIQMLNHQNRQENAEHITVNQAAEAVSA